jgi:predicted outer membrane repeat protein
MAVGGAVNGTDVTVYDSTFTGNSVKGSINAIPEEFRFAGGLGGGAIAGIQVNAIDSTFLRNSGPSGGAILTVGGCAIMQSNTFTGNQATARGTGYGGGAVHAMQLFCSSVFTDNLFSSNSAAGDGGALWGGVWTFGDELSAEQIKSIIEAPEGWSTNNTYSRNRAVNGGAIAFSTRLPLRVRYSTRRIERTNNVRGNVGGKNPVVAVVNWGP